MGCLTPCAASARSSCRSGWLAFGWLPLLSGPSRRRRRWAGSRASSPTSTPTALGKALVRLAPDLRQVDVDVRRHRTGQDRDRGAQTARPRGRGDEISGAAHAWTGVQVNFRAREIK